MSEVERYLKKVEMELIMINFAIYFILTSSDRHYTMKANILYKVGNYSILVNRKHWNTFPGVTAKLSWGKRNGLHGAGKKKSFNNQDLKCQGRVKGQPMALSFHRENTGISWAQNLGQPV